MADARKTPSLLRVLNVISFVCFFPLLLPSCMLLAASGGSRVDTTGAFVMGAIIGFPFVAVLAPIIVSNKLADKGFERLSVAVGMIPVSMTLGLLFLVFRE